MAQLVAPCLEVTIRAIIDSVVVRCWAGDFDDYGYLFWFYTAICGAAM